MKNRIREPRRASHPLLRALLESLEPRTLLTAYTFSTLAQFDITNGANPFGNDLTLDSGGNIFGTTQSGGAFNAGVAFEILHGTHTIVPIASFNGTTSGGYPFGKLVLDSAGNIYGVSGSGNIFVIPHGTHAIATIAAFQGTANGAYPIGLAVDSHGNLFGVTQNGGANSEGNLFEITKGSGSITILASFDIANGAVPEGNLLIDSHDNVYGSTEQGGANGTGALFVYAASSSTFISLASFDLNGDNGISPMGAMVMDSQGNLFGTAQFGGVSDGGQNGDGLVYELPHGSGTITAYSSFTSATGTSPFTGLVMDANGNLFGATTNSGTHSGGTLFEIAANSHTISVLASLPGPYGNIVGGNIAIDSQGNIFGMTDGNGNPPDNGSIFELSPTQAVQLAFSAQPVKTITGQTLQTITVQIQDAQGHIISNDNSPVSLFISSGPDNASLSGTTTVNAIDGIATFSDLSLSAIGRYTLQAADSPLAAAVSSIFSIIPSPLTALASFTTATGDAPLGNLIMDAHGNLFGVTSQGGGNGDGAIVELIKGTNTLTTLASFSGGDGANPAGSLLIDSSGNLFGITAGGGAHNSGTLFEFAASGNALLTLASFSSAIPSGGLVMDSSGNFFGITTTGGAGSDGAIFELPSGGNSLTTLASFSGITWSASPDGLILDSSGNLFGAAPTGGANNDGELFELLSGTSTITTLASFNAANGITPHSLVSDSAGNIYGITSTGGTHNFGTIFVLPAGSSNLALLDSFDSPTGSPVSLTIDSHGNLFGTASGGNGALFELPANSNAISAIASFVTASGAAPGGLFVDANGNLFGVTTAHGTSGTGTFFRLALAPAAQLVFSTQPTTTTAGQTLGTLTLTAQDADGYTIVSDDSTINLAIGSGPDNAVLGGSLSAVAQDGVATFTGLSLQTAGNYLLTADNSVLPVATSNAFTINPASATHLVFTASPTDTSAGSLSTVTVAVEDPYHNIVTTDSSAITISLAGSNGTLLGATIVNASAGIATFSSLAIHTPGAFSLAAADSGLTGATSFSFNISPGAPTQLAFTTEPASSPAGPLNTVTVAVEDPYHNMVTTDSSTITLSLAGGSGPVNGSLTLSAANGIATFSDLSLYTAGSYTLSAAAASLTSAASAPFTISPVAPDPSSTKLAFIHAPANATAGATLTAVTIAIQDAQGHTVTTDNSDVTLSIATGPGGSQLLGTLAVEAQNGIATFSDLSLQTAGTLTLFASDTTLASATSPKFTILPAAPAQITFQQNPSASIAGGNLAPPVTVSVADAFGNLITSSHAPITLSINSGPGEAQLKGSLSATLANGIATFRNLSLTQAGTYTLQAAGLSLNATSNSFTITPAAPAKLVFTQEPANANVHATISPAVVVAVEDRFGNIVTGNASIITLSIASGPHGSALAGVISAPVQNGTASFDALSLSIAGTYKLKATSSNLSALSTPFTVGLAGSTTSQNILRSLAFLT